MINIVCEIRSKINDMLNVSNTFPFSTTKKSPIWLGSVWSTGVEGATCDQVVMGTKTFFSSLFVFLIKLK